MGLLVAVLFAVSPASANGPEALQAQSGAAFKSVNLQTQPALTDSIRKVRNRRRPHVDPDYLETVEPSPCTNLPVSYLNDGNLFKNGQLLSRSAASFQAACSGQVAWMDYSGGLHKEQQSLGPASAYEISKFNGVVAWIDQQGALHRDTEELGRHQTYQFARPTGDVFWTDSWGYFYQNRDRLTNDRTQDYKIAAFTGDAAWRDSWQDLYVNGAKLGRASRYEIASRTGDVAWMDSYNDLHKNGRKVADDVSDGFELRPDGVLIWRDGRGDLHYE